MYVGLNDAGKSMWKSVNVTLPVEGVVRRVFRGSVRVRTTGYKRKNETAFRFKVVGDVYGYHRYECGRLVLCAGVENILGIDEHAKGFTLLVSKATNFSSGD